MKRLAPYVLVGCIPGGIYLAANRSLQHHDAAFNQMMWELWENPDRDRSVHPENDPRIKELQAYLDGGALNMFLHEPPFGAKERFKGVSLEDYNNKCLDIATRRFEQLKADLEEKQ